MSHPWEDFLAARLRLIHSWAKEGKSADDICAELNHHDVVQIRQLMRTDPSGTRAWPYAADLLEKAGALAATWREDGAGVDAGALVDPVYAVDALMPQGPGLETAVAIEAAVALLRAEGFTVTSPGVTAGLTCPACGADYESEA